MADALVRLAHEPDENAWATVVARAGNDAWRIAFRLSRDHAIADDTMQDTLLHIRERADRFHPGNHDDAAARRWIVAIAANTCFELLRHRKREVFHQRRMHERRVSVPNQPNDIEAAMESHERDDLVRQALVSLPDHYRTAVTLHYFCDHDFHAIAARLSIPLGTAKTHVRRGLQRLRRILGRYGLSVGLATLCGILEDLSAQEVGCAGPHAMAGLLHLQVAPRKPVTAFIEAPMASDRRFTMASATVAVALLIGGVVWWFLPPTDGGETIIASTRDEAPANAAMTRVVRSEHADTRPGLVHRIDDDRVQVDIRILKDHAVQVPRDDVFTAALEREIGRLHPRMPHDYFFDLAMNLPATDRILDHACALYRSLHFLSDRSRVQAAGGDEVMDEFRGQCDYLSCITPVWGNQTYVVFQWEVHGMFFPQAHGMTFQETLIYSIARRQFLSLEDIIPRNRQPAFEDAIRSSIASGRGHQYESGSGTVLVYDSRFTPASWIRMPQVTANGLRIVYQPSELSCHADGCIAVDIPRDLATPLLGIDPWSPPQTTTTPSTDVEDAAPSPPMPSQRT